MLHQAKDEARVGTRVPFFRLGLGRSWRLRGVGPHIPRNNFFRLGTAGGFELRSNSERHWKERHLGYTIRNPEQLRHILVFPKMQRRKDRAQASRPEREL